jgi:hypothetical protein
MDSASKNLPTIGASAYGFKVANVPKVTYLDPQSISNNYAWGLPVDFVFPKTIGKVIDMVLQIDVDCGDENTALLPSTPYWFERLETSIGGSAPFETVNKDELYEETVEFLTNQDYINIAESVNVPYYGGPSERDAFKKGRYFLPLWANCMITAQPYLKGFNSEWKLRFVLSNNQPTVSSDVADPAKPNRDKVNITGLRLLVTEAQLPPNVEARLALEHSKGITYNTINRVRHTDTKVITSAGDIEYTLTTFGNESAGVLLYIRPADGDYKNIGNRYTISYVNLRDAQGNPYYGTNLDGEFNRVYLTPWSINKESASVHDFGTYRLNPTYLLPFCANLGSVLEDGRDLGAYALSGKEKAVITLSEDDVSKLPSNAVFVAVSYDYMRIKVKGGQARVAYNRG